MNEGFQNSEISDHSFVGQRVFRIADDFADEFIHRRTPSHLIHVKEGNRRLHGKELGQKPERFLKDNLVHPILSELNYEFTVEPTHVPVWTKSTPDFQITNFKAGMDCFVLGEVKTPNYLDEAIQQADRYLTEDLRKPTIAFATDGFEWVIHFRKKGDSDISTLERVDLREEFGNFAVKYMDESTMSTSTIREGFAKMEVLERNYVEEQICSMVSE